MSSELSPRQEQAARLLATGETAERVAIAVGCGESTVYHWKKQPRFQQEIREQSQAIKDKVTEVFANQAENAARRIVALMDDVDSPARVQLDAAKAVIARVDSVEPPTSTPGIDPAWCSEVIDDLGQRLSRASWECVGHYYVRFGLCESVEEYMAWGMAQRAFYGVALDCAAQYWQGNKEIVTDPELMQFWVESRAKQTPEETRAWLERQHQKVIGTMPAIDCGYTEIVQDETSTD